MGGTEATCGAGLRYVGLPLHLAVENAPEIDFHAEAESGIAAEAQYPAARDTENTCSALASTLPCHTRSNEPGTGGGLGREEPPRKRPAIKRRE